MIKRPNGRWQAQVSRTEGGKRIRVSRTFDMKSEAEWWVRQSKRDRTPDNPYLRDYAPAWLRGRQKIRASTRALYDSHLRIHVIPQLGGFRVSELRPRHIAAFRDSLTVKPGTVSLILRTVKAILASAVREGVIPDSPALTVEQPDVHRPPVEPMTEEEAHAILTAVHDHWLEPVVRFLLGSGCRVGEACALNQGDIGEGYVMIRNPKGKPRATLVSEDALSALQDSVRKAPRRGPKEPVFFGPKGDRLNRASVSHTLARLLPNAGLPRRTPHALRHGVATLMVARGVHMRIIAEQLGNTERVASETYSHVAPRVARQAIGILDEVAKR